MAKIITIHASKMWPKDVCKKICYKDWSSPGYHGRSPEGRWFDICNIVAYSCYILTVYFVIWAGWFPSLSSDVSFVSCSRMWLVSCWAVQHAMWHAIVWNDGTTPGASNMRKFFVFSLVDWRTDAIWHVCVSFYSCVCVCDSEWKSFDMMWIWLNMHIHTL